ncbi:sensor histidine kinase [Caballeronia sp. Lep1P3]|uniref:sensor histidine kinase n=1 Tax=Caballeronia sp. Lep1P3 TaxID=2878150 RepID=UPI001FD104BE|nr:ATP-binding protein [Caballeronia sp. Lep1P3]
MNTSDVVTLDERATPRAMLRGFSPAAPESAVSPYSALIDAKLEGDREIQRLRARVRDLAMQLSRADERARRSLADDLHDETGAILTVASLAIGRAEFSLPADAPAACAEALRQARECLADVAETSHRLVEGLHAPALDSGLNAALEHFVASFAARSGIRVDLSCSVENALDGLSREMALALLRVTQEALGNVARHAHATHATVNITADAHALTLVIDDDGIGMTPAARRKSGRFGLAGMRARCEAFGGTLRVASSRSGGTSVRARLPWNAASRPALRAVNG